MTEPEGSIPWTAVGASSTTPPPYVGPPPSRRSHRIATAAIAVLAVGAGAFGITVLSAADGADSPEGAVQAMFDAVADEDVIGVLEALDPDERDLLRPAFEEAGRQGQRVDLAADDLDLRDVEGVDLTVEGLVMETTELGDGFTAVDLTGGTMSSTSDLEKMPFGSVVTDTMAADDKEAGRDLDRTEEDRVELAGTRLVATRSGGGWHVSALYSIAENARLDTDPVPAVPDFGRGIPAKGAASPEAAVRAAVDAAAHLDVRRLIELTPADEMAVLHDYGPALVAAAEDEADPDYEAPEVSNLELEVTDGPDGTKVVAAASYRIIGTQGDEWAFDGKCTTSTWTYTSEFETVGRSISVDEEYSSEDLGEVPEELDSEEVAEGETRTETETTKVCEDDLATVDPFFGSLFSLPGGNLRVVTVERDGAWFVSPSRSVLESTIGSLRSLTPEDVRRTARWWAGEYWIGQPDSFWEACDVTAPGLDASSTAGEEAYEKCVENLPDDYDGGLYGGPFFGGYEYEEGFEGEGEYEPSPSDGCYELDEAEVVACLEELVSTGEADPEELAAHRCDDIFEEALASIIEDDDAAVDGVYEAYDACMEEAMGDGSSTPTTVVVGEAPEPDRPGTGGGPDAPTETTVVEVQPADPPATTPG